MRSKVGFANGVTVVELAAGAAVVAAVVVVVAVVVAIFACDGVAIGCLRISAGTGMFLISSGSDSSSSEDVGGVWSKLLIPGFSSPRYGSW